MNILDKLGWKVQYWYNINYSLFHNIKSSASILNRSKPRHYGLFHWPNLNQKSPQIRNKNFLNIKQCLSLDKHFNTNTVAFIMASKPDYSDNFRRIQYRLEEEALFQETFLSSERWKLIIEKGNGGSTSAQPSFDTFILYKCTEENNLSLALSYLEHIRQKSKISDINFSALSKFLILLGRNFDDGREKLFIEIYEHLKKEEYLPQSIQENIIEALSHTKFWSEISSIIDKIEKEDPIVSMLASYNFLFQAVIREKGYNGILEYLQSISHKLGPLPCNIKLEQKTIFSFLNSVKHLDEQVKEKAITGIFDQLQKCEISIDKSNADFLLSILSKDCWRGSYVKIPNWKKCSICGTWLSHIPLDQESFINLRTMCETKTVKGDDIYQQTTPAEWNKFKKFLSLNAPYTLVIDGLNIMHTSKRSTVDLRSLLYTLANRNEDEKLLVISRKHSRGLFRALEKIPKVDFYFLDDLTKDDTFIIYAALYSGLGTKFFTKDFLRNHKFKMGDYKSQQLFHRWQTIHQMFVEVKNGRVIVKEPYRYHRIPQWNEESKAWHIPTEAEEQLAYIDTSHQWLCVRRIRD